MERVKGSKIIRTTEIHHSHALRKSPHAALPKGDKAKADCGNDDGEVRNAAPRGGIDRRLLSRRPHSDARQR